MQKLTFLFIVLTITAIAVTGTVLAFGFGDRHFDDGTEPEIIDKPNNVITSTNEDQFEKVDKVEPSISNLVPSINEQMLEEAGFVNPRVELQPFDGIIFKDIDINPYNDDDHVSYTTFENNERSSIITELLYPTDEIAHEIYMNIRNKITENGNFFLNETNQYGDQSFFGNNSEDKNSVFLVVKMQNRLYTLEYPAQHHNKIKNLILSLK